MVQFPQDLDGKNPLGRRLAARSLIPEHFLWITLFMEVVKL